MRRLRLGLIIMGITIPVFAIADLHNRPELFLSLLPFKLLQVVALAMAWTPLRWRAVEPHLVPVSRVAAAVFFVGVVGHAVLRQDLLTGAASLLITLYVEAFLLPVPFAAHLTIAAMAGAAMLTAIYVATGDVAAGFVMPALPLWIAGAIAPWVGYEVQRNRDELLRHRRALEQNQSRMNAVLDGTYDAIWDWDVQTGAMYYSPSWIVALGYDQAEVVAHVSFRESLLHPDDLQRVRDAVEAHFAGRTQVYECEIRLRTKAGEWRPMSQRGRVIEWTAEGRPLRMVGRDTDVSERVAQQQQTSALFAVARDISGGLNVSELLRRVEQHVTTALDCEIAGTFCWDPVSQTFRYHSSFGVPPEMLPPALGLEFSATSRMGQAILDSRPIDISATRARATLLGQVMTQLGVSAVVAAPLRVRDRPLGALFAATRAEGRAFTGAQIDLLHAIARQLAVAWEAVELYEAEHERAEESAALARVNREMIASLETSVLISRLCEVTAAVLHCDFARTIFHRTTDDSFTLAASFGDPPEQLEAMRVVNLPRALFANLLPRLEAGEIVQVVEGDAADLMPPGLPARLGVTRAMFVPLRPDGKLVGLLIAGFRGHVEPFSPLAQRIAIGIAGAAALALENARLVGELDSANAIKDEFVATMSHELRSPLNILIGYSDLLLAGEFEPLKAPQQEVVGRLRQQSEQLLSMINATLDLSRLETGRLRIPATEIDVAVMIAQLERETPMTNRTPGVEIDWEVDDHLPHLHTDEIKLKVVLGNLVHNALKFTEHGKVSIRARRQASGVEFVIADTGIGIPVESRQLIFEPFRQADASIPQRFGGTGLGLYIARRMVDLIAGRLTLESEVGRGSTFRVWLPTTQRVPTQSEVIGPWQMR